MVEEDKVKGPKTVQVRFVTKQQEYAIPEYPYDLPTNAGTNALNSLVNKVLQDDKGLEGRKEFDFLVGGEFLRGTLEELVLRHEALKKSEDSQDKSLVGTEEVFEVEYVERYPSPEPLDVLMHDDWVSAVDATEKWILTGCYDATLNLWSVKGKHKQAFLAHEGPVKKVAWIKAGESVANFASASHDQTIMIWEWDLDNNNACCKWICKGHERSVETLQVDPTGLTFASGSWDGQLKIWSASADETKNDPKDLNETQGAVGGAPPKPRTRTPLMTLAGHKESISSVAWTSGSQDLITASWDHTIKMWDVEGGNMKTELAGNKAFFDLSWSPLNKTAVTASADRHVRLYDPRSNEGSIVKATFTSHSGWVSSVNWSRTDENLFISGSHDNLMKLWDRRSSRAPLYNLTGHTDNILCTSWANPEFLLSGGSDNTLRIFKAKTT